MLQRGGGRRSDVGGATEGPRHARILRTEKDRLALFGAPLIQYAGERNESMLDWQRPVALLAYLACRPGWHSREALAEVFRSVGNEQVGKAYLRGLLHRTRVVFPRLQALRIEEGRVCWTGDSDVQQFERAFDNEEWSAAVALQSKPLLESAVFSGEPTLQEWFREERTRLRQRLASALIALIASGRGDLNRAELMQRLAQHDPGDESIVQLLLTHAASHTERYVAATALRDLRRRLKQSHQEVSAKTLALYAHMHDNRNAEVLHPPSLQPTPSDPENAPLGREREFADLRRLIRTQQAQLIVVCGSSGVGKTFIARALHDSFRDEGLIDVAWVDLVAVESSHGMFDAIASQLRIPSTDGPVSERVAHWLKHRHLLLFLDGFEQVRTCGAALEELLKRAPAARALVTAREPLRLVREHIFPLDGLVCHGTESPAIKLFETQAARIGRRIEPAERTHIPALVEYLGGVPLFIELAANWVSLLPVHAILAELKTSPTLLDIHEASGRSRSMHSVLDTTWRRLENDERKAISALSTIVGWFNLAAARDIAACDARILLRLVRKSLLQRSEDGLFRMHPLLRDFAASHSDASDVKHATSRHAQYFLRLVSQSAPLRIGRYMPKDVALLRPHMDDVKRAWQIALVDGPFESALDALPNLIGFFMMEARYEELLALIGVAASRLPRDSSGARLMSVAQAFASLRLGRMREAQELVQQADSQETLRSNSRAMLWTVSSRVHRFFGRHQEALDDALKALKFLPEEGSPFAMMQIFEDLALAHSYLGNLREAEEYLVRNLTLSNQNDARYVEAKSLCLLGILKDASGSSRDALAVLEASERMFVEMGDIYHAAYCRRGMSYVYLNLGNLARQAESAATALQEFSAAGYEHEVAESTFALVVAHDASGQFQAARAGCLLALQQSVQFGQMPIALRCIGALGAFTATETRRRGFALMAFAGGHMSLRRTDTAYVARRFEALGASAEELALANEDAANMSFEEICQELLGAV